MDVQTERLARLKKLAEQVYPDRLIDVVVGDPDAIDPEWDAAVIADADGDWQQLLCVDGPRALDALEAALCLRANVTPRWAEDLASRWEGEQAGNHHPVRDAQQYADELRAAARKGPWY